MSDAGFDGSHADSAPVDAQITNGDTFSPRPDAGSDVSAADVPQRIFEPVDCGVLDNASVPLPAPGSIGSSTCVTVGAVDPVASGTQWPVTSSARLPLLYVDSMATAGGDGTIAHPFNDLPTAVTAMSQMGAGTIVLAGPRQYVLAATLSISTGMTLLGPGAAQSHIMIADVADGIAVSGSGQDVAITGVGIIGVASTQAIGVHVEPGASATLNDVLLSSVGTGIVADGAVLTGQGISIRAANGDGVDLINASDATLRDVWIFQPAKTGMKVTSSRLTLVESGVVEAQHGGIVMTGASSSTAMGAASDHLDRVSLASNVGAGLYASDMGRTVTATSLLVQDTRASADQDGHGMMIVTDARITLDPMATAITDQGRGSQFRANQGAGILVSTRGGGSVTGAIIGSNELAGMMLLDNSKMDSLANSWLADNRAAGLFVSSGSEFGVITCNGFIANQYGMLTVGATPVGVFQSGLVLAPGAAQTMTTQIVGNRFADQDMGFGMVFEDGSDVNLVGNTFSNTTHLFGQFDGAVVAGESDPSALTPTTGANSSTNPIMPAGLTLTTATSAP